MTTTRPPITKDSAQTAVRDLVKKFRSDPHRHQHNEQKTREYYILPLFRALGWDTESPSEFTAEEQISRGFVDFGFYLHGTPVFYVETKAKSVKLKTPENIRQAIRYAYMRGVTWAILTDFEQIFVYNAEWDNPRHDDVQVLHLKYDSFADAQFDSLWLLSKPAFATRQLDRFAESFGKKATREPVTTRLFRELTVWRKQLFDEFRGLSQTTIQDTGRIDNAVQRLIDRLIFIRSMEDREIEPRRLLSLVRENDSKYAKRRSPIHLRAELNALFKELDGIYNSNIFAHSDLDDIEFKSAVADIIEGLYGDMNLFVQYDFNAISADVLGAVYEQYLSFKAQDPTAKTAITAKSVKRKTQGIYYTPQFIVRYIIQNTVGRALEAGANPLTIRILDPACGSGSFLIEAFDFLDRWLGRTHPDMSPAERRDHILQHNLYGVDLDEQAVEVTRLNLLLRAAYQRRLLPPLTHIRHGDSLITPKFDYRRAFESVFADGGFDVVVGNPPYVRQETLGAEFKAYMEGHYSVYAGTADLYVYFIERGVSLLREGGRLGFILPNKWMRANYGKKLRAFLDGVMIDRVVDFGDLPVFPDATTYPSLLFLNREPKTDSFYATDAQQFDMVSDLGEFVTEHEYTIARKNLRPDGWSLAKDTGQAILDKIRSTGTPLGEYVNKNIYRGITTGYNEAFVIDDKTRRDLIAQDPNSADVIKPFLSGREIKRYDTPQAQRYLIYIPWGFELKKYPAISAHLEKFKEKLSARPEVKQGRFEWFAMSRYGSEYVQEFEKPKIIYPDIAIKGNFILDIHSHYATNTLYIISSQSIDENYYLLGILNSELFTKIFSHVSSTIRGGYLRWIAQYMEKMPIPTASETDRARLIGLVQKQLAYHAELGGLEKAQSERKFELEEGIRKADMDINQLVAGLYGVNWDDVAGL